MPFRHALLSSLLALGLCASYLACSSDSKDHPPLLETGGTGASGGASAINHAGSGGENVSAGAGAAASSEAGESSGGSAGSSGSGVGGAAGEPTFESDAGPGRLPSGPADCSETATWSGAKKLAGISVDANQALSLTADELDLAFVSGGALYAAHRAQTSDDFTVGAAIALPSGWTAATGFALSDDGKRLVLVNAAQTALGELTRSARDAAFAGNVDETAFSVVNQASTYSGNAFSFPVLSADDTQLFLSSMAPSGGSTVVVATRTNATDAWSSPTRIGSELDGPSGGARLPTGISADARTLFYFNQESMQEEARWRDTSGLDAPLYDMVDFGARRGATPNTACNRLYSVASGSVVVESD